MYKFITVLFIQILCGMEMDLFIPSLPELQSVFQVSPAIVQTTLSINFTAFCICSLFAGSLGDKYNRRHILLMGLGLFVLGSIVCVFAPTFTVLILGRLLQGIGISAPAILSFPVLLEEYSETKQAGVMGIINGAKTLAMAVAPVIGSLVNLYFNWRGNFSVLLGLGIACLITSYFAIPSRIGDKTISLSLKSYLPLLRSRQYLILILGISLLTSANWMFMGMAPILYIEDLGVPLNHFGYYQGALSLTFTVVCILSPVIYHRYNQRKCLLFGLSVSAFSLLLILLMMVFKVHTALFITAAMIVLSIGIVFPINILYPGSLTVVHNTKGRSAGLGQAIVLILTALWVEMASYFYNHEFTPIGSVMIISLFFGIVLCLLHIFNIGTSRNKYE